MSNQPWKSDSVQITPTVFVEVRAAATGVVLGQSNDVWFHDLHISPEDAIAIAAALTEDAVQCRAMRSQS